VVPRGPRAAAGLGQRRCAERRVAHGTGVVVPPTSPPPRPQQTKTQLVLQCHEEGMNLVRMGDLDSAFDQFKYAEAVLIANDKEDGNLSLLAVTCSNLGSYYKITGKLHAALSYLRRALKIEVSVGADNETLAATHLNLCSVLSKLQKHEKAEQHALCALELLGKAIANAHRFEATGTVPPPSDDAYAMLSIAYHNLAVQREHRDMLDYAAIAYKQAFEIARRLLPDQHQFMRSLVSRIYRLLLLKGGKELADEMAAGCAVPVPETTDAAVPPVLEPPNALEDAAKEAARRPATSSPVHKVKARETHSVMSTRPPTNVSRPQTRLYSETPGEGATRPSTVADFTRPATVQARSTAAIPNAAAHSVWAEFASVTLGPKAPQLHEPVHRRFSDADVSMPAIAPLPGAAAFLDIDAPIEASDLQNFEDKAADGLKGVVAQREIISPASRRLSEALDFGHKAMWDPSEGFDLPELPEALRLLEEVKTPEPSDEDRWASASADTDTEVKEILVRAGRKASMKSTREDVSGFMNTIQASMGGVQAFDAEMLELKDVFGRPPNDYRPNRCRGHKSRAAQLLLLGGGGKDFEVSTHRDRLRQMHWTRTTRKTGDGKPRPPQPKHLAYVEVIAATRIQGAWRRYRLYCTENEEWFEHMKKCAWRIQMRWKVTQPQRRAVRAAAVKIQTRWRGFFVRLQMWRRHAAVRIQKRMHGKFARQEIHRLNLAVIEMQRLVRGGLTRKFIHMYRAHLEHISCIIQKAWRSRQAYMQLKRDIRYQQQRDLQVKCVLMIQSLYRRKQALKVADEKRYELEQIVLQSAAATMIQSCARRQKAKAKVRGIRDGRMEKMHWAATTIRKQYLMVVEVRRLHELKRRFKADEGAIVVIQRFARGFLVRLRLVKGRTSLLARIEAATNIQKTWRGFLGCRKYESRAEVFYSRPIAAARIQRYWRGSVVRRALRRRRAATARGMFEVARARFYAAQRIQAVARGGQVRHRLRSRKAAVFHRVVLIQRAFRLYLTRKVFWYRARDKQAVVIQRQARRLLVQRRLQQVHQYAAIVQVSYRAHLRHAEGSPKTGEQGPSSSKRRADAARCIQRFWRQHQQQLEQARIWEEWKRDQGW